jgi:hypothetical protein
VMMSASVHAAGNLYIQLPNVLKLQLIGKLSLNGLCYRG